MSFHDSPASAQKIVRPILRTCSILPSRQASVPEELLTYSPTSMTGYISPHAFQRPTTQYTHHDQMYAGTPQAPTAPGRYPSQVRGSTSAREPQNVAPWEHSYIPRQPSHAHQPSVVAATNDYGATSITGVSDTSMQPVFGRQFEGLLPSEYEGYRNAGQGDSFSMNDPGNFPPCVLIFCINDHF